VDAPPPFTNREETFLRALLDEGVEFLVVGLAAASLQGVPAVTQDIDLWFRDLNDPRLKKALKRVGAVYVAPTASSPPVFAGEGVALIDIVVHMHGLAAFRTEARRATRVRVGDLVLKVLPLDRIIASKKATGRPKDLAILETLEDALRVRKSRRDDR